MGGTLTSTQNYAVRYLDCNQASNAAQLTQDVEVRITGGDFSGSIAVVDAEFVAEVEQKFITGGTFSTEPSKAYIASGYEAKETAAGWEVTAKSGMSANITPPAGGESSSSANVTGSFTPNQGATGEAGEGTVDADSSSVTINVQTGSTGGEDNKQPAPNDDVSSTTVTVDKASVSSVANAKVDVTLQTDVADLAIPAAAWADMAESANNETIDISVAEITSGGTVTGWTVTAKAGNNDVFTGTDLFGTRIAVTVDYASQADAIDVYCTDDGQQMLMDAHWNITEKKLTWWTPHFSTFKTVERNNEDTVTWVIGSGDSAATGSGSLQNAIDAINTAAPGTESLITLTKNITVTSADQKDAATTAIFELPDGVTLNGNGFDIIVKADAWATSGSQTYPQKNPIIGVTTAGAEVTIQNLTIIGHSMTRHGINVWANESEDEQPVVNLYNVEIQNCGTAAIVVTNGVVNATNLVTSGNDNWGAVSVDNGGKFNLSGSANSIAEDVQIYSEDQENVKVNLSQSNFSDMQAVTGKGDKLKGFTYYTDDVSKLGEATVTSNDNNVTVYEDLDAALATGNVESGDTITLLDDVTVNGQVKIDNADVILDGNNHTLSAAAGTEIEDGGLIDITADKATVQNMTINTNGSAKYGVQFYNSTGGELIGVTINGGYYSSVNVNASEVDMKNCTLNPGTGSYATIDYSIGSAEGLSRIPEIALNNVTTNNADGLKIWADNATVERAKALLDPGDDVAAEIRDNIVTTNNDAVLVSIAVTKDGTPANITIPSTKPVIPVTPDDDDNTPSYSGGSSSSETSYSNTIDASDGGSVKVSPRTPSRGETVTITPTPDTGYEVDEVIVTDRNGDEVEVTANRNGTYTFEQPRGRVNIEVTFVRTGGTAGAAPFLDVAEDAWYADAVAYVYDNGLMSGTSTTLFSPNATTTRGMIVTMLYRLEGEPRISSGSAFDDVDAGMYYADAVAWASQNDIVTGYDEATFGPNNAITREQMAAILYRYAQYKGYRTTADADLSGYVDADSVSSYALASLQWANAAGLVTGTSSNTLTPDGSATRAQVATIFMRFMEDVAE